jgi:hypothetical protein
LGDHRVQFLLALRDKPKEPDPAALKLRGLNIAWLEQIANRFQKSEGRLRFRKRPSYLDGDKPNSVSVIAHADDHLSHPDFSECPMLFSTVIDRRYSSS